GRAQRDLTVAQLAEQALAGVGDRFQVRKAEEGATALDRVQCAKYAPQGLAWRGGILQAHQVRVELVQVLMTLDQEFLGSFLQFGGATHARLSSRPRTISGLKLLSQMADTPSCCNNSNLAGSLSVVTTITGTSGVALR